MDTPDISRRKVLSGLGVLGTAALGAGFAVSNVPTARATVTSNIGSASVTSNAGRVKNVVINTTGRLQFDGLERAAEQFRIRVYVSAVDGGGNTVVSETRIHDTGKVAFPSNSDDWGGAGEVADGGREGYIAADTHWYIVQQDGASPGPEGQTLPNDPVDNDHFTVDTDSDQKNYTITVKSRYDLYDGNGNAITGSNTNLGVVTTSGTVDLTVTNEAATTSTGDADAEGNNGDNAGANTPAQE